MKISAYIILHMDDDFLEYTLTSVDAFVDEFIVVDGAYKWVEPFLSSSGIDANRSGPKTMQILDKFSRKVSYFSGTWEDELQKREFGYSKCTGDIIVRIDADEIYDFNHNAILNFFQSSRSVAQMEYPLLMTNNLHRHRVKDAHIPRQAFMFKRSQITAEQHCGYLWLVLTPKEQARRSTPDWARAEISPVARVAHLTSFRKPNTSVNRARFYTLLYIRTCGHIPWESLPDSLEGYDPDKRIHDILSFMSADEYTSFLKGHQIVSGFVDMKGFYLDHIGFQPEIQKEIDKIYREYIDAIDCRTILSDAKRTVVNGMMTMHDITNIVHEDKISVLFFHDEPVIWAKVECNVLLDVPSNSDKSSHVVSLSNTIEGSKLIVDLAALEGIRGHQFTLCITQGFPNDRRKASITAVEAH